MKLLVKIYMYIKRLYDLLVFFSGNIHKKNILCRNTLVVFYNAIISIKYMLHVMI
jgi:hypothetical protein